MLTHAQKWLALASAVLLGWLLYLLAPILAPFLFASLLAYLGDPLVDRLQARRLSRTLATSLVVVFFGLLIVLLPLLLLPILAPQVKALIAAVPTTVDWMASELLPWLNTNFGLTLALPDAEHIKAAFNQNIEHVGSVAADVVGYVSRSGLALSSWLASLVLVPVVTFYMLRDWDDMVAGTRDLIPRQIESTITALTRESDEVLAAFLRGQVTVMICLGTVYSLGLWIAGLESALAIGLLAGLVSFVPYLGVIVGLVTASLAVLVQTHDWIQLLWVFIVFGVGQMLEGMVLTPWLVGDRIGLHPVAVIFAVLAGGQLFGFMGILLALPVAAVLAVLVRHARERYRKSGIYGEAKELDADQSAEAVHPDAEQS